MYNLQLYDQLLKFSLFQGLSKPELQQMAGNTKFGFLKLSAGKTLLREGDVCTALHFLISGQLKLVTQSDDHSYTFTEQLAAPWLLQPEVLFGAQPRFSSTVQTLTEAHFITLSKDEVFRLTDDFLIVRLNLFNLLATQAQRRNRQPWRNCPDDLRGRVVRFFLSHCAYPAGAKEVGILMERLARELNASRLDVSRVLNAMQAEGLLVLHRGRITIPMLEHLLM